MMTEMNNKEATMKLSKSKLALAKVINENGGWPSDEANFAAQDKIDGESNDNTISFYSGKVKPTRLANNSMWRCENSGSHFMGYEKTISGCELIANWHQACLSIEEYYQAYPKADADGWIEWGGGEFPALDESGSARRRDGVELSFGPRNACNWRHDESCPGNRQIVAYRLHKPEKALGELCGNVTEENRHEQVWTNPPTIEQLAADYRNAKYHADRKQQEADASKADADEKLRVLAIAGEALGLLVSPITTKQEPELVITDWRDLRVGDVIEVTGSSNEGWGRVKGKELTINVVRSDGASTGEWLVRDNTEFRIIRRP